MRTARSRNGCTRAIFRFVFVFVWYVNDKLNISLQACCSVNKLSEVPSLAFKFFPFPTSLGILVHRLNEGDRPVALYVR